MNEIYLNKYRDCLELAEIYIEDAALVSGAVNLVKAQHYKNIARGVPSNLDEQEKLFKQIFDRLKEESE